MKATQKRMETLLNLKDEVKKAKLRNNNEYICYSFLTKNDIEYIRENLLKDLIVIYAEKMKNSKLSQIKLIWF